MKYFSFIFFLLFLFNNIFSMQQRKTLQPSVNKQFDYDAFYKKIAIIGSNDKEKLKQIAEEDGGGYGYKYANLKILEHLCELINTNFKNVVQSNYIFNVPEFVGISSSMVKNFLSIYLEGWVKVNSLNLKWKRIVKNRSLKKLEDEENLTNFYEKVKKIRDQIADAFDEFIEKLQKKKFDEFEAIKKIIEDDAKEQFGNNYTEDKGFSLILEPIKKIIQIATKENKKLMVRSTGGEDRIDLANAGGNESVIGVDLNFESIFEAIKKVVVSYFSEKSLQQRIKAKDKQLFSENNNGEFKLLTPVLLQVMSGEPYGGTDNVDEISSAGVLFTKDPEVGFDKAGPIKVNASFGHNAGVVEGIVSTDTYYIGSIFATIVEKKNRIVPILGGTQRKKNPSKLVKTPSLSKEVLSSLHLLSKILDTYYLMPTDVEFVVNFMDKKINIVQARPITYDDKIEPPSYLNMAHEDIKNSEKIKCIPIISAGGSLRFISDKDSIIVNPVLKDALDNDYDTLNNDDACKIKCVICSNQEPSTSHAATEFRRNGVAVVRVKDQDDFKKIKQLVNGECRFIIDVQQEVIVSFKKNKELFTLENFKNQNIAFLGWFTYPAPLQLSLNKEFLDQNNDQFEKIFKDMFSSEKHMSSDDNKKIKEKFQKLFYENKIDKKVLVRIIYEIKTAKWEEGGYLLNGLFRLIRNRIVSFKNKNDLDAEIKGKVDILMRYFVSLIKPLRENFDIHTNHISYMKRLFFIKQLESLLFQQPDSDVIKGYSFLNLIVKEVNVEEQIKKTFPGSNSYSVQYLKLREYIFSQEVRKRWQDFSLYVGEGMQEFREKILKEKVIKLWKGNKTPIIEKDELLKKKAGFGRMIKDISSFKVTDLWLNTVFATESEKKLNEELLTELLNEYEKSSTFIQELRSIRTKMQEINLDVLSDSKKFKKTWKFLKKELLKFFLEGSSFVENYEKTGHLGKIVFLKVFNDFVDKFDLGIKSLKVSSYEDEDEKNSNLKLMIRKFLDIFLYFCPLGVKAIEQTSCGTIWTSDVNFWQEYIVGTDGEFSGNNSLKTKLKESKNTKTSKKFDASVVAFGSSGTHRKTVNHPESIEDIFMFAHQSVLNIIASLAVQVYNLKFLFPEWVYKGILKNIGTSIKDFGDRKKEQTTSVKLIALSLSRYIVEAFYNIPVDSHSVQVKFIYDYNDRDNVVVEVSLYTIWESRLNNLIGYIKKIAKIKNFEYKVLPMSRFRYKISKNDKVFEKLKGSFAKTDFYRILSTIIQLSWGGPVFNNLIENPEYNEY
jgi:hypothetical protein